VVRSEASERHGVGGVGPRPRSSAPKIRWAARDQSLSEFEYISIAVSLVLTFGVARLLNGLPYLFSAQHPYWVHSLWCVQAIVNYAMFWWLFWNFRDVERWTLGSFLLVLLYPAICYVGAALLIPGDASKDTHWRSYFFGARRAIFAVFAMGVTVLAAVGVSLNDAPLFSAPVFVAAGFVALYVVGLYPIAPESTAPS
jgi:hypothetical protein